MVLCRSLVSVKCQHISVCVFQFNCTLSACHSFWFQLTAHCHPLVSAMCLPGHGFLVRDTVVGFFQGVVPGLASTSTRRTSSSLLAQLCTGMRRRAICYDGRWSLSPEDSASLTTRTHCPEQNSILILSVT
jgi:hypothetical protein